MKINNWIGTGALVAAGISLAAITMARADNQAAPFTPKNGGNTNTCPGVYYGYAKMTNSTGTLWITPPANTTSGTLTDASGYPPPYGSSACVSSSIIGLGPWCSSNSVTFPVTNGVKYGLTIYVNSTPAPTNGQPIQLQITWQQ